MYHIAIFPISISPTRLNVTALNPKNVTIFAMFASDLSTGQYQGFYMHTVSGSFYLQITLASIDIKGLRGHLVMGDVRYFRYEDKNWRVEHVSYCSNLRLHIPRRI